MTIDTFVPDLRTFRDTVGPLRDKYTVDISTNDFELATGFICQVATAGNLTYQTLAGNADQSENSLAIGTAINVGGIPVILKAVRATSTVTSIVIGVV